MQDHAGDVMAEGLCRPDRAIQRVGEIDDRPRHLAEDDVADVGDVFDRPVVQDRAVVVVDVRIVQGVEIDQARIDGRDPREPPVSASAGGAQGLLGEPIRHSVGMAASLRIAPLLTILTARALCIESVTEMSLRILHVTPYFADAWGYGGIPRVATALARELGARGHAVTVCTTDAADAGARTRPSVTGPTRDRLWNCVDVHTFSNASNTLAYHLQCFLPRGLDAFLARHAREFDVAHLHACRNLPVDRGAPAARGGRPLRARPEWHRAAHRAPARGQTDVRRDRRTWRPSACGGACSRSAKPSGHSSRVSACPPTASASSRTRSISRVRAGRPATASFRVSACAWRWAARAVSGQGHAAQARRRAGPRVRAAAIGRTRVSSSPATTWARCRRFAPRSVAPGLEARTTLHGSAARRRAARGAGRRRRRRLSLGGRGLRPRAARGAAGRHPGRRRRRFRLRRDGRPTPAAASSCRSATMRR